MKVATLASLLLVLSASFLLAVPARANEVAEVVLASGTAGETTAYVRATEEKGPTVVVIAGMHGNETAGWRAARILRHWPITRGKLVVLPRANQAGIAALTRKVPADEPYDLNRCFPSNEEEGVSGTLAKSISRLVQEHPPDWLVDLHESVDYRYRNTEEKQTLGNSVVVYPNATALTMSKRMAESANALVNDKRCRWQVLRWPIEGSLARAAATRLGARALIVETCRKDYLAARIGEHLLVVHRLLSELGMLPEGFSPHTFFPAERVEREVRVGIYNSIGTGSRSAWQVERCLTGNPDLICRRLTAAAIRAGSLESFDVVVFPGGTGSGTAKTLGEAGRGRVREFVEDGGGFLGICAGAYLATRHYPWSLGVLDARVLDSAHWNRGRADLRITFSGPGRRLFRRSDRGVVVSYNQGPILAPGDDEAIPDYEVLAVFDAEVAKNGAPRGVMIGTPAFVRGRFGEGRVAAFSPHPERSKDESLRELVERTIFWLADRTPVRPGGIVRNE